MSTANTEEQEGCIAEHQVQKDFKMQFLPNRKKFRYITELGNDIPEGNPIIQLELTCFCHINRSAGAIPVTISANTIPTGEARSANSFQSCKQGLILFSCGLRNHKLTKGKQHGFYK
jgi:hypothetical protein